MTSVSDGQGVTVGWETVKCAADGAAPAKDASPAGATSPRPTEEHERV